MILNVSKIFCIIYFMELDFTSLDEKYENLESLFLSLLKTTFTTLKIKANALVSLALIDDEKIQEINKQYRNIDKSTDVISFAFLDNNENRDKILKSKKDVVLGDIYISIDHALAQSKAYGHSEKREFSFLFVHGLLHLLGYDHIKKEDEEIMFPLQEEILSKGDYK